VTSALLELLLQLKTGVSSITGFQYCYSPTSKDKTKFGPPPAHLKHDATSTQDLKLSGHRLRESPFDPIGIEIECLYILRQLNV
jgi:hypothetical protein